MSAKSIARSLLRSRTLVGLFALSVGATGCASAGGGGGSAGGSAFAPVTPVEISSVAADVTDTYDLLQRLRPNWLNPLGGPALLYVDGQRRAEAETLQGFLQNLPVSTVQMIEWERPEAATLLPQAPLSGRVGGAIMITSRGGE